MKRALLYLAILALACGVAVGQSQYKVLYNFGTTGPYDGSNPNAGLVYRAGEIYGTTWVGGNYCYSNFGSGCGTVFALGHFYDNVVEAVIYSFCTTGDPNTCSDGAFPYGGGLIADDAGNLYGMTMYGGNAACSGVSYSTCGTVFQLKRISKDSWEEVVLHRFDGSDGMLPIGGVIFDNAGNLYGTTALGGLYGGGTVFELSPNPDGTWALATLHDFNPTADDGEQPLAGLVFDSSGNLYGTTVTGGGTGCQVGDSLGCGIVFQLSANPDGTWTENIIYRFRAFVALPKSALTFDNGGNLYGTAWGGTSGGVFRLSPTNGDWKESAVVFRNQGDGYQASAPVSVWRGALYGTTFLGGNGHGNIFKIQGGHETVLHNFCSLGNCTDGAGPFFGGPLLIGGNSLYGTTVGGGNNGQTGGVVFQFTP